MDTSKLKQYYDLYKEKFIINQQVIYTIFFYTSIVFAIAMIVYRYTTTTKLNEESFTLNSVTSYSLDLLKSNESIREVAPFWKTLNDMLDFNVELTDSIAINKKHREELSLPFDNFLYLYYTPSLNIWRDPFKQTIDTTLIGKKYLDNNSYGDIALMEQWTDFFKDVGIADSFNKISNINIWSIEPLPEEGYFGMTIKVNFESPDKRSFLLLVNKLSMTAYLGNVSLINEFVFYVWENIKKEKSAELEQFQQDLSSTLPYVANDKDKLVGYLLYDWISGTGQNVLVTPEIITKSIRQTAGCIDEDQRKCNYLFRQKMRNIPYLAYGVGRDGTDQIAGFKKFFQYIPPILSIEEFSFEELKKTKLNSTSWYKWSVTIKVYGKDIMSDEINTISNELWLMCFSTKESLQSETAIIRVQKHINEIWSQTFDTRQSTMLNQILLFATTVQEEYPTLPNNKKIVRLFELYRTLKENNLCDIIDTTPPIETVSWTEDILPIQDTTETTLLSGDEAQSTDETIKIPITDREEDTKEHAWEINGTGEESDLGDTVDKVISTWTIDQDRTIGDGNTKRDQQLMNELEG